MLDEIEARPEVTSLIVVDDASTDATAAILAQRAWRIPTRVERHRTNRGKGAALRTGISLADDGLLLVQDADLEYDPADYPALLAPFHRPGVEVVYGTRSFGGHSAYSFWYVVGNNALTTFANVVYNTYLTDIMTCYKVFSTALWRELDLQANGFAIEAEITGKLLRRGHRIFEVPISYNARTREEGKKLTWWRDGPAVINALLYQRLHAKP